MTPFLPWAYTVRIWTTRWTQRASFMTADSRVYSFDWTAQLISFSMVCRADSACVVDIDPLPDSIAMII